MSRLYRMILLWVFLAVSVSLATVATSNLSCPTWFYYTNATQRCECGLQIGYWVRCNQQTMEVEIMNSICMTYSGQEGQFYIGYCSLSYKFNHTNRLYSQVPTDPDLLEEMIFGPYNRKGFLCGECIDGYAPGVYSLDDQCVDCSKFSPVSAICLYLLLEFVPITLLFVFVVILQLNFTAGPMLGYLVFCHSFSFGFKALVSSTYEFIHSFIMTPFLGSILLVITESWSLNFLKSVIPPFCISSKLTDIQVTLLNSVSTIYPALLVIVYIILIDLYSRYNTVGIFMKPLSAVFRKISCQRVVTSNTVIHTFALFLFLSSTKSILNLLQHDSIHTCVLQHGHFSL